MSCSIVPDGLTLPRRKKRKKVGSREFNLNHWGFPFPSASCGCCVSGTTNPDIAFIVSETDGTGATNKISAVDSSGNIFWTYTATRPVFGITRDPSGNVYLGWSQGSSGSLSTGTAGIYKLDPNGNLLSTLTINTQGGWSNLPGNLTTCEANCLKYANGYLYLLHFPDASFDIIKKYDLSFNLIQSYGASNFASGFGWVSAATVPLSPGKLAVYINATGTGSGTDSAIWYEHCPPNGSSNSPGGGLCKIDEPTGALVFSHSTAGCFQDMTGGNANTYVTSPNCAGFAFNPNLGASGYVCRPVVTNWAALMSGASLAHAANPWSTGTNNFCAATMNWTAGFNNSKSPYLLILDAHNIRNNTTHQVPQAQKSLVDISWLDGNACVSAGKNGTNPQYLASVCAAGQDFLVSFYGDKLNGVNPTSPFTNLSRCTARPPMTNCGNVPGEWTKISTSGVVHIDASGACVNMRNYNEISTGSGGSVTPAFGLANHNLNDNLLHMTYSPNKGQVMASQSQDTTVYCFDPGSLVTNYSKVLVAGVFVISIYGAGNDSY